jgi:CubicO group peptidase (beta-lactamase class C family)
MNRHIIARPVRVFIVLLVINILTVLVLQNILQEGPEPVQAGNDNSFSDYGEDRIRKLMRQHHLPSVAVAVIVDQETLWHDTYGYADVDQELPAKPDTIYKLYSVAKVFTAIETMRLVEEGLVDLDAPITDVLPDFNIQSRFKDSGPITVRSILTHHAGLPRNGCTWVPYTPQDPEVLTVIAASVGFCHSVAPVGERYHYSNLGSDVLGYVIEKLRGQTFASYMQEHLLTAAGMESSAFLSNDLPAAKDEAWGYTYSKRTYIPLAQDDITSLPSGNLYASLEDMESFVKFLLREGESDSLQYLQSGTLQMMYKEQYPDNRDPHTMGLGWKIARILDKETMIWHDGGPVEGTGALVALLPEKKLGIVLIANGDSFGGNLSVPLAVEIFTQLLINQDGMTIPETQPPVTVELDAVELQPYTGRYIVFGQALDVTQRKDHLVIGYKGIKLGLVPVETNRFVLRHWLLNLGVSDLLKLPMDLREIEVSFKTQPADDADVMVLDLGGFDYEICPKYPTFDAPPPAWQKLVGSYALSVRLPSGEPAEDVFSHDEIVLQDGVLMMPGVIGPLLPISETEILILTGSFAGETITYDLPTNSLAHQWVIYRKDKMSDEG